jgi:Fe-S-cluster containining protein
MRKRIPLDAHVTGHFFTPDELRPCGECTACCTALGVEELHKPNYTPCRHLCDKGCGIYAERPGSCKTFECWWRVGMVAGDRPDKSGIIVDSTAFAVRVWEVKPGALNWKSNRKAIDKLRRRYPNVIEGNADTWGKVWVETASPEVQAAIRGQQNAYGNLLGRAAARVAALLTNAKEK